jgi:hypothetical protein
VNKIDMTFYSCRGWKSGCIGRVVGDSGVYSMLRFRLEGGVEMKRCQKMKRKQRARLGSMGTKCDTVWRCGDIDRRRGDIGEGKSRRRHLLS